MAIRPAKANPRQVTQRPGSRLPADSTRIGRPTVRAHRLLRQRRQAVSWSTVADGSEADRGGGRGIYGQIFDYELGSPDSEPPRILVSTIRDRFLARIFIWSRWRRRSAADHRRDLERLLRVRSGVPRVEIISFLSAERHVRAADRLSLEWNYVGQPYEMGIYALGPAQGRRNIALPDREVTRSRSRKKKPTSAADEKDGQGPRKRARTTRATKDWKDERRERRRAAVVIDFDGLGERVMRVPVDPGEHHFGLSAVIKGHLICTAPGAPVLLRSFGCRRASAS